jgi:hypothetical protein
VTSILMRCKSALINKSGWHAGEAMLGAAIGKMPANFTHVFALDTLHMFNSKLNRCQLLGVGMKRPIV